LDTAISLEGVRKSLKGREILKGVSFTVTPGDIFGYLGPNGAGKTTTIRILLGLLSVSKGRATIQSKDVSRDDARKRLGFVLEADGLYDNVSAWDNIAFYAEIYRVPKPGPVIERVLESARLTDRARDKVGTFSKGMRQRLALARAMVSDPDILVLDEPTAGIDPTGQIEVRQIVQDMAHKQGKTILLSSHNLDEVQRTCNRIALIARGEIKMFGLLEELQRRGGKGEVVIETGAPLAEPLLAELGAQPGVAIHSHEENRLTISLGDAAHTPDIVFFLAGRGVRIEQVVRRQASLEELYTNILKEAGQ
jgi:ABC-2 type transport system ATP-binding protein